MLRRRLRGGCHCCCLATLSTADAATSTSIVPSTVPASVSAIVATIATHRTSRSLNIRAQRLDTYACEEHPNERARIGFRALTRAVDVFRHLLQQRDAARRARPAVLEIQLRALVERRVVGVRASIREAGDLLSRRKRKVGLGGGRYCVREERYIKWYHTNEAHLAIEACTSTAER